ncbi:MAG: chorismate synthase [Proteobacteria bacterium]|nr:chorismate synthase [Pseudomonadota bacterium]MBU2262153.1 chorismate synthase [Pseudomonadota bacterium]
MSGNTIGVLFKVTTWGESHGPAVGAVIDGCPPRIDISETDIQAELDRRRPGGLLSASPRREADRVEILSGVFEGKTTGTPISLMIRNADAESAAYEELRNLFRPGHGDITYQAKYGIRDHRGGGRASGRETAGRVAAGAVARKIIGRAGMAVTAFTRELGGIVAGGEFSAETAENPLRCPDPEAGKRMIARLEEARATGDTLGGIVEIRVRGCPPGLGEPVFGKIDGDLAGALMGIGTVKGVEIGAGFAAARMTGSACNDTIGPEGFRTNNAGGILAGITSGAEIVIRVACKPIPSIARPQETIDIWGNPAVVTIKGRHDAAVIPRIIPVCEAMVSIVLADHLLRQRAIAG